MFCTIAQSTEQPPRIVQAFLREGCAHMCTRVDNKVHIQSARTDLEKSAKWTQRTTAHLHPWDATAGTPTLRVPLKKQCKLMGYSG